MRQWRGLIKSVKTVASRWHRDVVEIRVRFEIFDDAAPELVLHPRIETWNWPLAEFDGMNLTQIANLVLNVGLIREEPPPPGSPPGTPPTIHGPMPPPLRPRGIEFLADFNRAVSALNLPLPIEFGP